MTTSQSCQECKGTGWVEVNGYGCTHGQVRCKCNPPVVQAVMVTHSELLAAIRTVNEIHGLGDAIYSVRENIDWKAEPFDGSSWDHPRVKRYSDAVEVINRALKESA